MQAAAGRRAEMASAGARVDGGVEYSHSVFDNGADVVGQTVSGTIERTDGTLEPITVDSLLAAPEAALRALTAGTVALAVALLVLRLT